ncbi:MAG: DUF721 domain-containing protein [Candidatus Omnitrophica bacterium]|nr:DUF721 domain-containing protein [Candidatus Omnitrophota bacterium]
MKAKQKSIEDVVKDVIKKLSGKNRVGEEEITNAWREAAGAKAAGHSRPVAIKKGVLTINVDGSGWLYELTIKKRELLEKLKENLNLKGKQLKNLRFRIGDLEKRGRK